MKKLFLLLTLFSIYLPFVEAFDEDISDEDKYAIYAERKEIYSLKNMYDYLSGNKNDNDEVVYEDVISSNSYWWPIGSIETTIINGKEFATGEPESSFINSDYGYRYLVIDGKETIDFHSGIDIGRTRGIDTNVIASKSGTVVYPNEASKIDYINYDPNYEEKYCGKANLSYGNYVIIQHADGNYTLYGHLSPNSITVKAGDVVEQGQVIAKMGSSGCSTGAHLHFEMRIGSQSYSNIADPLEYVSIDNPRPVSNQVGGSAIDIATEVIEHFEGIGCMGQKSIEGDNYIACDGGDGVLTIGPGVTYESNIKYFEKYGYPVISVGTRVPIDVVQSIKKEIIQVEHADAIYKALAEAGIDNLKDYQVAALISRSYQCGGGYIYGHRYPNFIDAYLRYNGKYSLDDMYSSKPSIWMDAMNEWVSPNWPGAYRRRVSEWILFNTGEINYLEDGFDYSKYAWQ